MRKMLVATVVVGLVAAAANATVTYTLTLVGSVAVQNGDETVNVWEVSFTSDSVPIAGLGLSMSDPAYQIGVPASFPSPPFLTPTMAEAGLITPASLIPGDTHFLLQTTDFSPAIAPPTETNDFIFGPQPTWSEGLGVLSVESGLALSAQALTVNMLSVALLPGDTTWVFAEVGDTAGDSDTFEIFIPEPATMTMLGVGAVAMFLRRRRS